VRASKFQRLVQDKFRLLPAITEKLAGGHGHIPLEGSLNVFNLSGLPGASSNEAAALKRNTIWPKQDFLVFRLELAIFETILHRPGRRVPHRMIHIQFEKSGILEFGAYDNFDPDRLFFGPTLAGAFLESLVSQGTLSSDTSSTK
jgi:hypothetical protein